VAGEAAVSGLRLLGLDIETTGSEFRPEIKTIQIGVYDPVTGDLFRGDVGWPDGSFVMVPEATAIHHFTYERIVAAPSARIVDESLTAWLTDHGVVAKRGIAIGFNVGAFDMPFVRRDLPLSGQHFSYRAVDLNAICFALAEARGVDWQRIKKNAVGVARAELLKSYPQLGPHDAGWDSVEAVLCYRYLVQLIGRGMA
jgi:hypothetical protein